MVLILICNNNFLNNKTKRNSHNSNMLSNININTNATNINLNATNIANKINTFNPIIIKKYVKNSTNFFFSLLSKISKNVFSL